MATISIDFNVKSIKNAIEKTKKIRQRLASKAPAKFIQKSFDWIKNRANENLMNLTIGLGVIADIIESWNVEIKGNVGRCYNTSNRAVFIEFGVGVVGQSSPHPNSSESGYEYNMKTPNKDSSGAWIFKLDDENMLDIKAENILSDRDKHKNTIRTRGQEAQLYLYNALMDFYKSDVPQKLWNETMEELYKEIG